MKIKLSKSQWEVIGKKSGWLKTALEEPYGIESAEGVVGGKIEDTLGGNDIAEPTSTYKNEPQVSKPFSNDKDIEKKISAENFFDDELTKFEFLAKPIIKRHFDADIQGEEGEKIYTIHYRDVDKAMKIISGDVFTVMREFNRYINKLGLREKMLNTSIKDAISGAGVEDEGV